MASEWMNKLRRTEERFLNPEHTVESPGRLWKINLLDTASRKSFQSVPQDILIYTQGGEPVTSNNWKESLFTATSPFLFPLANWVLSSFVEQGILKSQALPKVRVLLLVLVKHPQKCFPVPLADGLLSNHHPGREAWPYFLHITKHPQGKINHHAGAPLWPHSSDRDSRFLPAGLYLSE